MECFQSILVINQFEEFTTVLFESSYRTETAEKKYLKKKTVWEVKIWHSCIKPEPDKTNLCAALPVDPEDSEILIYVT